MRVRVHSRLRRVEMEGVRASSGSDASGVTTSTHLSTPGLPSPKPSPDSSKFASSEFDAVDFLNALFPDEHSLRGVDELVGKLKLRISRVDDEILTAVRGQAGGGAKALSDLQTAQNAIASLESRVGDIKHKAATSEAMVTEICADVKKLDFAKKHLTSTITSLRRLSMLCQAVDQLETHTDQRVYKESANLLAAVTELSRNFEHYVDVGKVDELITRKDRCAATLKNHVFEDFFMNWQPSVVGSDANAVERLKNACLVLDALQPEHRDKLIGDLQNKELLSYASVFDAAAGAGGDGKSIEQIERRFSWIKRNLTVKHVMFSVFPRNWKFPELLTMSLCKLTRANLAELLDSRENVTTDDAAAKDRQTTSLIQAMHKTLAFEKDLDLLFGLGGRSETRKKGHNRTDSSVSDGSAFDGGDDGENLSASEVRARHARLVQKRQLETQKGGRALPMDSAANALADEQWSFVSVITSVFEDHLSGYVDLEEAQMVEELGRLISLEKWGALGDAYEASGGSGTGTSSTKTVGSSLTSTFKSRLEGTTNLNGSGSNSGSNSDLQKQNRPSTENIASVAGAVDGAGEVLPSAGAVFLNVKKVFKRASTLTTGKPLLAIHGSFSRVLRAYAGALSARAKEAGVSLESQKTQKGALQKIINETLALCLIVNTAEWCAETVAPLGESMRRTLTHDGLRNSVTRDVDATEEAFHALAGEASGKLVSSVLSLTQIGKGITGTRWDILETVGDQSTHVDVMSLALTSATTTARRSLRKNTVRAGPFPNPADCLQPMVECTTR